MMNFSDVEVTTAGISFSVHPTFRFGNRRPLSAPTCFISNETLGELAMRRFCKGNLPEEIFRQLEKEITGVAARLALAGVHESPLVIRYKNFTMTQN